MAISGLAVLALASSPITTKYCHWSIPVSFIRNPPTVGNWFSWHFFLHAAVRQRRCVPHVFVVKYRSNTCFCEPGGFVWMLLLHLISQLKRDSTYLITMMGFTQPICKLSRLHFYDHKKRKAVFLFLRAGKEWTHFLYSSFVCLEIHVSDVSFCTISVSSIRRWSGRSGWKTAASLLSWGQSPKFQMYPFFVFHWNMISMRPQQASL